ncbi:hypothetical protein U1Q18_040631 [Sarracenia purpurea var. burkii]
MVFPLDLWLCLCSLVGEALGNGPLGPTSKFVKGLWGSLTIQVGTLSIEEEAATHVCKPRVADIVHANPLQF